MKLYDYNGNEIEANAPITTSAHRADQLMRPASQTLAPAAAPNSNLAANAAPAPSQNSAPNYRSGIKWIDEAIADGSITALDMQAAKEVYGIDIAAGLKSAAQTAQAQAKREAESANAYAAKATFAKDLTNSFILTERILDMADHAEQGGVLNALGRWVTKKTNSLIEGSDKNDIFSNVENKYINAVMQLQKVKADRSPGIQEIKYNEDQLRFGFSSPKRIKNRVAHWAQEARNNLQYQIDQINEQGAQLSPQKKKRLEEIDERLKRITK